MSEYSNNWISVKDKLPKHMQTVIAINNNNELVVVDFVYGEEVFRTLIMHGIHVPDSERKADAFCSRENRANVLNNVTHWMPVDVLGLPDKL